MDGKNQNSASPSGHSDLNPDEPISLRHSAAQSEVVPPPLPKPSTIVAGYDPSAQVPEGRVTPSPDVPKPPMPDQDLSWTASEFIAHPKTVLWYLSLTGVTIVLLIIAWLIAHDLITVIVIVICAGLFGYSAGRQPRQLQYGLNESGITIGPKHYPYTDFRAFAVIDEGPFSSVDFVPLKRFAPMLSIYYDPAHEPYLMEILTQHLPFANHQRTMIDGLMNRIRF